MDIEACIKQGFLMKETPDKKLIEKEMKESQYDLESAKKAISGKDYKWGIIKSYYSMFHAGKAACFSLGYREKKHIAVLIVLEHLNKEGKLEGRFIHDFKAAMAAREGADYQYSYSTEKAEQLYNMAKEFLERMKKLV